MHSSLQLTLIEPSILSLIIQPSIGSSIGLFHSIIHSGAHVTRFIGLAEVGNASKQKSLHALALVPASQMDVKELQQKPADTTAIPFKTKAGTKRAFPTDDSDLGAQVMNLLA